MNSIAGRLPLDYVSSRSVSILNSAFFAFAGMRADCHLHVFFIQVNIVFGFALDRGLTVSQYGFISIQTVLTWFPTRTRQTKST
jgi:hypothetical protein